MTDLSRSEQETHFSQTAEDRINGTWHVYTDDPVWINRLDALCNRELSGVECVKVESHGGKHYRSQNHAATLSYRRKRQMSEETRAQLAEQLRKGRAK